MRTSTTLLCGPLWLLVVIAREAARRADAVLWVFHAGQAGKASEGRVLGLERFGASAPYQRIYEELGLTVEKIVETAREIARP